MSIRLVYSVQEMMYDKYCVCVCKVCSGEMTNSNDFHEKLGLLRDLFSM